MEKREVTIKNILREIETDFPNRTNTLIPEDAAKLIYSLLFLHADILFLKDSTHKLKLMMGGSYDPHETGAFETDCLWYGIIALYGRCFTSSKGNTSLQEKIFNGSEREIAMHKKLMKLRNTFVAHRPVSDFDVAVLAVTQELTDFGSIRKSILVRSKRIGVPKDDLDDYLSHFNFLGSTLAQMIEKRKIKIMDVFNNLTESQLNLNNIKNILKGE